YYGNWRTNPAPIPWHSWQTAGSSQMKRVLKIASSLRLFDIGCGSFFSSRAIPEEQMAVCVCSDRIRSSLVEPSICQRSDTTGFSRSGREFVDGQLYRMGR